MTIRAPHGAVIGKPGLSEQAAQHFGDRGKAGTVGEVRTGALLAKLAEVPGGPTVIHDLRIPIPGFRANIDHAVISGREVTLVDSKLWKDGFYWTLGATRRGFTAAPYCDKKTLPTGVAGMMRAIHQMGVKVTFRRSVLVVWAPDQNRPPNLRFYRPQSAIAVAADASGRTLRRLSRLCGAAPANPQVVSAVSKFLYV